MPKKAAARPATKTTARKKAARRAPTPPEPVAADAELRLVETALKILAKKPWREVHLAQVARTAEVPLAELTRLCPSKVELLSLIARQLARKTQARYVPDAEASSYDRVFEVAMSWFEALAPYKRAAASLHAGLRRDPLTVMAARAGITAAAGWLLALAQADQGSLVGARNFMFAVALGRALPVWLTDDADLSRTMAFLDKDLRRAETLFGRFVQN